MTLYLKETLQANLTTGKAHNTEMPICPKCGKLISEKKFTRHKLRCGTSHRKEQRPFKETTMW